MANFYGPNLRDAEQTKNFNPRRHPRNGEMGQSQRKRKDVFLNLYLIFSNYG